ncbi:PREDICTED: uncharacterized protein LOC109338309 [Lupinus angustifolius]|uniref:Nonsense-mediated mRNA decay protein 2-like protein n=2 Tax=Lupinus angustifolius TaxID=3871 RepID=A0A451EHC5_LUPAN|nr:PREDICTED: uncharacterized protein LOC109338309 [Lupinus angustifolius]AYQ93016.1 nonsense-mediated mRNA decay protein 2-like protein [Lupinus angustifolius]
MTMEKANKQQIFSKLCSISGTLVLPLILSLVLFSFLVFISISKPFPFLLTLCIILLSTMFLVTLTKKKGYQEKNLVHDKLQKKELQNSIDVTQTVVSQQSESTESESSTGSIMCGSFEIDHNGNQNVSVSDNSASENDDYDDEEEDNLIEIKLQRSFLCDLAEEPKQKLESNLPDFMEQGLMELLAEINEDENLIEIDISMGSTNS